MILTEIGTEVHVSESLSLYVIRSILYTMNKEKHIPADKLKPYSDRRFLQIELDPLVPYVATHMDYASWVYGAFETLIRALWGTGSLESIMHVGNRIAYAVKKNQKQEVQI